MNVAVTSVVRTGRRMQSSDNPMFRILPLCARATPRAVGELHLTFGHNGFAPLEAALEHRILVEDAGNLEG